MSGNLPCTVGCMRTLCGVVVVTVLALSAAGVYGDVSVKDDVKLISYEVLERDRRVRELLELD